MFKLLQALLLPHEKGVQWSSPPHWIEPERRVSHSRAGIHRDMKDRRRWMRDTGIL